MQKILLLLLGLALSLSALTLKEIEKKPSCRARDLLLWEFLLQENISEIEAKKAYALVENKNNPKILKSYIAKVPSSKEAYKHQCQKRQDLLEISDKQCLRYAFSLYKTYKLTSQQKTLLLEKDLTSSQEILLKLQSLPYDINRYYYYPPQSVVQFLRTVPKKEFQNYLDTQINRDFIHFLSSAKSFSSFVSYIVHQDGFTKTQQQLLSTPLQTKLNFTAQFDMALLALSFQEELLAVVFLQDALELAKTQQKKDQVTFWLYLITQKESYLQTLLESKSINIYTLYAYETLQKTPKNYVDTLQTVDIPTIYNLEDPFDWHRLYQIYKKSSSKELKELQQRYKQTALAPFLRLIIEKETKYKFHIYLHPYDRYLQHLQPNQKALVYALMRQESDFIPSAISRSFALGLMQLMPFLVDHLAKQKKEKIQSYTKMFDPQKNISYALSHLEWLEKNLHANPLFTAYAYNGGYGFFRRYKQKYDFVSHKFDPFFSMEMMQNSESREYGKKVLANYAIYSKIFGVSFSLKNFFQTLQHP